MARNANSNVFLEEWLRVVSGSSVSSGLVKQDSAPSARSIIQAWSEIRESLQSQRFDTRYLQALRALVSSESTIHVADPQAKLLIAILSLKDVSLPYESCTLVMRLLYVWIRKAFRPSQALVGSAVQAIRGVVVDDGRSNLQPVLLAQSVLVAGAFASVHSLSGELKVLSLELLCRLLEGEGSLVGSREELVPVVLAGIGYGLSSSSDVHYVRLLDSLFGCSIWLSGSVTHGLMILHLVEWVVSGYMRSNYVNKMSLFANEVLETSKADYTPFAVLMAAAGVLRASAAGSQNLEVVSKLRNSAEKRLDAIAQILVANGSITQRDDLLLKCFAIALARCGTVSPSPPLLLCLASALLTQVFPLDNIYESFCKDPIGPRLIWVREHLSGVLFKESGAITGAFCNQYAKANEENKYIVENMVWDFCQNLYLQHRQIALLLRGVEDTLLGDIEKIAESSFLMVVVFALAVTKQWLNPIVSEERKMETSVKILVSFSCVEYFRHIRLPEYMETIREVISCVQENDATCVSFVESIPAYGSLTNPKDLFTQRIEYEWSRDDVQTSRILFYLRVIPTCIGRLSASAFRRVVASTMFLYIGHPNRKVARASHTLFVAFLSSAKESEEDERNQLKEDLVYYYMERSLEGYPEITPFEGLASGVAALTRHLPAGSPAIFYSVHSLVEKGSTFNTDESQGRKSDPGSQILDLLLRLVSLVDIQVLPYLMKSLAQLIIVLPKEKQNMVLGELYGQVAESDDVIRKPSLVSWLQSLNYLCSNNRTQGSGSGPTIDTSNQVVDVYSKEEDHKLNVYHFLMVANPESLRPGFVIRVSFFFVMLNQSGKELYRTKEICKLFCDKVSGWGCYEPLPLEFETNKITLKLEVVKVVEVVDWNEMIEFNGFQIHYSQVFSTFVESVNSLFLNHRGFEINFRLKNELLKTTYMNVLLALVDTLNKPPHSLTETELSNARSDLVELTEAGFKLNWLKTMLDEVSLDRNKENIADHGSQVEQHIKEKVEAARDWLEGAIHSWKGHSSVSIDSSVYPKLSCIKILFLVLDISDQLKSRFTSGLSLPQISENLVKAAYDPRIAGVYLHIEPLSCGWGKVEEIRRHILDFKKSGKFIVGYINICGLKEYYLGCSCSELYAPPSAYSFLYGLTVQASFLGGVFEKVGIEPQVQRIGKYKSAGDQLARKSISEENYEMLSVLLDNIYANWLDGVSDSTGKKREDVESFINQGVYEIEKLKEEGLIKDIRYDDEVISMLKERLGVEKDKKLPTVDYKKYSGVKKSTIGLSGGRDQIAIIRAGGSISRVKGPLSTPGSSIVAEQLIEKIRSVRENKKYKAAVIRIDSPGGDALASDLMWREIKLLAEAKPVVASMSDVAASGGYYMAMAANTIVAENLTLTGSIGVVTARFTLAKLYEKIGFNKETISRGKYAELLGAEERPFKPEEAELFGKSAQHAYQLFRNKAALSRSMPVDKMEEVAQGRVWTGKDAHSRGLVDALGGLSRAIAIAKQKANIPLDKKVTLVEVSRPSTSLPDILSGIGSSVIGVDRTLKGLLDELTVSEGVQARMDGIMFQQLGRDSLASPIIDLLKDYLSSLR
ncbi:unnamed protein product [Brassica rapa]|uniref:Peptidase S49 domain-containing protein n=1 Tax=Brassica campestris TaxID=3711 RepID=A0A8D9MCA7_BRACM|nr:unnamed protein product [Brassica rapa]